MRHPWSVGPACAPGCWPPSPSAAPWARPARYGIAQLIHVAPDSFPWATFWTNISGSFALGLVLALIVERFPPTRYLRPFVATGFLGAYTTYSTFAVETDLLVKDGHAAIGARLCRGQPGGRLRGGLGGDRARPSLPVPRDRDTGRRGVGSEPAGLGGFLVAAGASVPRCAIWSTAPSATGRGAFPWGTFVINASGSLAVGHAHRAGPLPRLPQDLQGDPGDRFLRRLHHLLHLQLRDRATGRGRSAAPRCATRWAPSSSAAAPPLSAWPSPLCRKPQRRISTSSTHPSTSPVTGRTPGPGGLPVQARFVAGGEESRPGHDQQRGHLHPGSDALPSRGVDVPARPASSGSRATS